MSKARATRLSEAIENAAAEGRKRRSYFSFGDDGLTATVGASGSLLRITKHFPGERTGYCVDHPATPEPFLVRDRLQRLLSWSKRPFCKNIIGPHIDSLCHSHLSTEDTSMTNDRWPTFHRELKNGDNLKLQYVASEGTVFQIFEMNGGEGIDPSSLAVAADLLIRDLDFVDDNNQFNNSAAHGINVYSNDVRGNCIIRLHENAGRKAILYIQALDEHASLEFEFDKLADEETNSLSSHTDSGSSENYYTQHGTDQESSPRLQSVSEQSLNSGSTIKSAMARRGSVTKNDNDSQISYSQSPGQRSHATGEFICQEVDHETFNLEVLSRAESTNYEHKNSATVAGELAGSTHLGEEACNEEVDNEEVDNEEVDNEEVDNEEVDNEEVDNEEATSKESIGGESVDEAALASRRGASRSYYRLRWKSTTNNPDESNQPGQRLHRVILTYTVDYVSKDEAPIVPMISWDSAHETTDKLLAPWEPLSLSSNQAIDLSLRRNLEHVLSVCSIPVPVNRGDRSPAIALTCGDLDGHRVATAASFYAFQILLFGLGHFDSQHRNKLSGDWVCECHKEATRSYVCFMKRRILRVCRGHMKWLFKSAGSFERPFCPNYWVDGSEIKGWQQMEHLPGSSLVDTPFQLIKIGDFYKQINKKMPSKYKSVIKKVVGEWAKDIDELDKRNVYAFPRYDDGVLRNFHLTDHVLIWQAIRSAEYLGVEIQMEKDYSSKCIQRSILEKFTTQNSLSKKQMVSVRRSPAYTSFLLRSKDSPVFRAMDEGLFDSPEMERMHSDRHDVWRNKVEAWRNTVECQMYHENNDDTTWDDPQKFALALVVAKYLRMPINLRTRQEMLQQAITILFSSSSANGLFPGKLDKHHEPRLYETESARDQYWANTFEIPYIFGKYCPDFQDDSQNDREPEIDAHPGTNTMTDDKIDSQQQLLGHLQMLLQGASSGDTGSKTVGNSTSYSMKHSFPFNNMVDENNIIELQDEWLYDIPAFFAPSIEAKPGESSHRYPVRRSATQSTSDFGKANSVTGYKIDYLKFNSLRKRHVVNNMHLEKLQIDEQIDEIMARGRTPEGAKKRWWVLSSQHPSGNEVCLRTISRQEKKEKARLKTFFQRHVEFSTYFAEETKSVLNTWTTELHLSFPLVRSNKQGGQKRAGNMGQEEDITFPPLIKGEQPTFLSRGVMSFKFEGDFFDRYWTCGWLLAHSGEMPSFFENMDGFFNGGQSIYEYGLETDEDDDSDKYAARGSSRSVEGSNWDADILMHSKLLQQRRFLELMLYFLTLLFMNGSAANILETTTKLLEKGKADLRKSFAATQGRFLPEEDDEVEKLDYKGFLIVNQRFQEFQTGLRRVEAYFAENLATIDQWLKREKDRGAERPRWSFNDESRYGSSIIKATADCDKELQEFKSYHIKISSLIKSTTEDLELMRNYLDIMQSDLDVRRSEDIRRFTYVSVVFLPLGFATGIFSMSEAPRGTTLVNMILTAVATFVITVLALIGAKIVDSPRRTKTLMTTEASSFSETPRQGYGGISEGASRRSLSVQEFGYFTRRASQEMARSQHRDGDLSSAEAGLV